MTGGFKDEAGNYGVGSTSDKLTVVNNNTSNSAPTFTSESIFSAPENQKEIGTVTATDADGDTITYTISSSDITINSSSGIIAFASSPNYENKSSYTATISASDGVVSTSQDITVNITDKNDAPTATAASYYLNLLPQDQSGGNITLSATDEDGDTLTYVL